MHESYRVFFIAFFMNSVDDYMSTEFFYLNEDDNKFNLKKIIKGVFSMGNSKILLVNSKDNREEFNVVLQKWKEYITEGTFKRVAKVYSRRNYIYS